MIIYYKYLFYSIEVINHCKHDCHKNSSIVKLIVSQFEKTCYLILILKSSKFDTRERERFIPEFFSKDFYFNQKMRSSMRLMQTSG